MASYHFHFQQQDEGPREDVRTPTTSAVPFVSPYVAVPYSDASLHAFQRRARPTQAPHVTSFTSRPARPRRHRQYSRSRSPSTSRSRSRRRRRTRRSRTSTALPQDPELLWLHVLRQRRCHLFQCILRILSILLCLVRHQLVLLLCLEQQLQRRNHHRLCLLRCHRATHDHKSFHLKPRLFTFVH